MKKKKNLKKYVYNSGTTPKCLIGKYNSEFRVFSSRGIAFLSLKFHLFAYVFSVGCARPLLLLQAFSIAVSGGHSPAAACGPLAVVASLVAEHRLQACGLQQLCSQASEHRLNSCDSWTQLLCGVWDLPRPRIELVSPALAGRHFTTEPPRKPPILTFDLVVSYQEQASRNGPCQLQKIRTLHPQNWASLVAQW